MGHAGLSKDEAVRQQLRSLTRRGFLVGGAVAAAGITTYALVYNAKDDDGIPWPLRRVLGLNERLGKATFDRNRLSPEFSPDRAAEPRVNGHIGLSKTLDSYWRLHVESPAVGPQLLTMQDIRALPRSFSITRFADNW